MGTNAAIELKNITKTFGHVVANKDVCLTVNRGEILSILGENGSGKTTLMNMISGIYFPRPRPNIHQRRGGSHPLPQGRL